ncbi:MAG: 30S ribosomal protein S4 [Nanobdellota archaeon]
MGDPKRCIGKFKGPRHPWEADRIAEEKDLLSEYGLKNKKEIWKVDTFISEIKTRVKYLSRVVGKDVSKDKELLLNKLLKYNLLKDDQELDEALNLTAKDALERRLQTLLVRNNSARSFRQARQFIVHGHIKVNGKKITAPGYFMSKDEQFKIEFSSNSKLNDPEHPERAPPEKTPHIEGKSEEKNEEGTVEEEVSKKVGEKLDEEVEEDE